MTSRIPNLFHFVFGLKPQTRPFHLIHYLALESCLRVNRPDRLLFHYHHEPWGEYWELIRERITPVRIRRPKIRLRYSDPRIEAYSYAHESDFVRLDVLLRHGGVYADIDTIFVNPISPDLFHQPFVLGREDDIRCQKTGITCKSVCNALIMAQPQAEFGAIWRDRMESTFDGSWSRHSTILPSELADAYPSIVHIEPSHTFYPFMWTREDLRRLFEGREKVDDTVASIHLWAHLWWSRSRLDFSDIHAGQFTESNIHGVDNTFSLLVRPFLPDMPRSPRPSTHLLADIAGWGIGCMQEALVRGRRRIISGSRHGEKS